MPELTPTQVLARHYGSLATRYPMSNATQAIADLKANGYEVVATAEVDQWRRTLEECEPCRRVRELHGAAPAALRHDLIVCQVCQDVYPCNTVELLNGDDPDAE